MRSEVRGSRYFSIVVCCIAVSVLAGCLKISGPLHNGKAGGYYKTKIAVTGGSGKYQFTLTSGTLPTGLTLASNGTIAGTIATGTTGIYTFKVKAVDAVWYKQWYQAEQTLSIGVDNTPYKWTLLCHFAVDNNIDYDFERKAGIITRYLETLEDIEARDLNNDIQIILMMDAYNPYTKFADGYYCLSGGAFADDLIIPVNEINSGSVNDTQSFLNWAVARYPSERYMYSIFNHGHGFDDPSPNTLRVLGIGFDDSNANDRLTHTELRQVTGYLKGLIGRPIDIFYPFACLMNGVELAYEVRANVDLLLGSEEAFPADRFSYQGFDAVIDNPDITPQALGRAMCDQAHKILAERMLNPRAFNLSLIDLSRIDALYGAIDAYAHAALADIDGDQAVASAYNTAADNAFTMLADSDIDDFYYVDLGDYLHQVSLSQGIDAAVKAQAQNVQNALTNAVVYQRQFRYPQSSGLTIFHNIWYAPEKYSPTVYRDILLFGANTWTDYVAAVTNLEP